jgi:hypothetical protein
VVVSVLPLNQSQHCLKFLLVSLLLVLVPLQLLFHFLKRGTMLSFEDTKLSALSDNYAAVISSAKYHGQGFQASIQVAWHCASRHTRKE